MSSVSSHSRELWTIEAFVPDTCIEWRFPEAELQYQEKSIEGEETETLLRDSIRVLYFAPGSWLVINGDPAVPPSALPSGVIGVDVIGKWNGFLLDGSLVDSVLRTEVQLGIVLAKRQCAATSMFDCPVLIYRAGDRYELWVQASYSDHLQTQLAGTAHRLAGEPGFRA